MPSSTSSAPLPLGELAELVHHAAAGVSDPHLVFVAPSPDEQVEVGLWAIPPVERHVADCLVGFRAPDRWDAVGLVCTGRARRLDERGRPPVPVVSTVLARRDGTFASVLGGDEHAMQIIEDRPIGWVADVLARTLGLPTPPAPYGPAVMTDLAWVDRIATGVLARPDAARHWRWLADRHPFRGRGPVPEPALLRLRALVQSDRTSWSGLLELCPASGMPAARSGPPGGTVVPSSTWFDEGSLCSWLLRDHPPIGLVLADVLEVLPEPLADQLREGLTHRYLPPC